MDSSLQPLGIGLIGYGNIARVHAMAYRDLAFHYGLPADRIRLIGVATSRPSSAQQAAVEIGCPFWTGDYRELLARSDIQAVDITVPNDRHEEVVLAAAAAGKHIYCEKPPALDVPQARRMAEAVRLAGVKAQITFNNRFIPAALRARQLMDEGFVGRIFSFRARYFRSSYISAQRPFSWRLSRETSGGGALFDLGSHVLDLVRYLVGEVTQVHALLDTRITERPLAADPTLLGKVEVDDLAMLQLRLAGGAPGVVECSRLATGATNELELEVFGDAGAIRLSLSDPDTLQVYDVRSSDRPVGGRRGYTRVETAQRYEGQLAPDWTQPVGFVRAHAECQYQFLQAIWHDRAPKPDFEDGVRVQQILAAAQRSSEHGRWVDVQPAG